MASSEEGEPDFGTALAGSLAFLGTMIGTAPFRKLPGEFADEMASRRPITSPAKTPLQNLAEFTREEVRAIQGFARQQGVKTPILSAGPGARTSYFRHLPFADRASHIGLAQASVPIAMHEVGHASPALGSTTLRTLSNMLSPMSRGMPGHILRGAILGNLLRGTAEGNSGVQQFAYEHAPELMGASYAPMLLEEARASGHAIRGAKAFGPGRLETLKQLTAPFSTYLAKALTPVLAAVVAKKVVESLGNRSLPHEKEAAPMPMHEVKAPGVLRVGASAAWRMRPSSAKPKSIRPNTNPSARGKDIPTLKPPSNTKYHKDLLESLHNPQRGFRIAKPG